MIDTQDKDIQWASERRPHKSVVQEAKMLAKNKKPLPENRRPGAHMVQLKKSEYVIPDFDHESVKSSRQRQSQKRGQKGQPDPRAHQQLFSGKPNIDGMKHVSISAVLE